MRVILIEAKVSEGGLRELPSEDGPIYCFDTYIVAETELGMFMLDTYFVPGAYEGECGYCPNYNYKVAAQAMVDNINARGYIETDHWHPFSYPSLMESLEYAYRCEQEERMGWA